MKNNINEEPRIDGFIIKYGENDYGLGLDMLISAEDTKKIMGIIEPYINDGTSVRGTWAEIKEEL